MTSASANERSSACSPTDCRTRRSGKKALHQRDNRGDARRHILQKLDLRDRVQAVVLAHQTGLFESTSTSQACSLLALAGVSTASSRSRLAAGHNAFAS